MNQQQQAFLRQARSDWELYHFLQLKKPRIACHELHYLQMATEKFAKAFFWGTGTPPGLSHASFAVFMKMAATKSAVRKALGIEKRSQMQAWVKAALPLVVKIENLAPQLAQDGPNPEYPWPPTLPSIAPVDYNFGVIGDLSTAGGRKLIHLIERLFATFEVWS